MAINFNDLGNITFDGTVYNEVTKSSDNTSAITQEKSNVTYDNFLLHSSKEWLSTIENISSELVKDVKDTSSKVKADNKVVEASKKSAPDAAAFKNIEGKITEGVKDFATSVAAMTEVTKYSGAINFISSTAVNTVAGAINTTADMGISTKTPSNSITTNVNVTNAATSINRSDTIFTKTDRDITITNEQLLSAKDKHNLVTNTTSSTSKDNKTAASNSHQVISNNQSQYSNTHTTLTSESTLIASKGATSLLTQGGLVIGSGQTDKPQAAAQASVDDVIGAALGKGSIKILSSGPISTISTGTISNQGDSFGASANKIGLSSIDFASNSTTTTISSKTQSTVSSDGITYTGNRNMGISINPFGILVGSGVAPLIPFLSELLPPIVIDIPELPEFPFGDLSDFLSKCLPFTSPIDLTNIAGSINTGSTQKDTNNPKGPGSSGPKGSVESGPEELLITLEDPLVSQTKGSSNRPITLETPTTKAKEPKAVKGIKTVPKDRDITTIATVKTDPKQKEAPYGPKQAVANASKLGILHKVYIDTPEGPKPKTSTTVTTSDVAQILPTSSLKDSLMSLMGLQKTEVVNSFNVSQRSFISNNYNEFMKAVSVVDIFSKEIENIIATNPANYSKVIIDILKDKRYIEQIQTFLNTKRPTGVGGQQPPNIQDDISNPISDLNTGGNLRTPPNPGQGILDVLTSLDTAKQSPSLFSTTTENWFTPQNLEKMEFSFGDELDRNANVVSISDLLNNQYVDLIAQVIPNSSINSALSLTRDIAAGRITTPEQYATRLAALVGGDVSGYIGYAEQAINIYSQVQQGNYTSLLGIPGINKVLGSQGTAIASKVLGLISKKNITDQDIYSLAGSIFTSLTGIGIPLLDELAKLLGCVDSLKEQSPVLQNIPDSDLQDIIDYLPRIIQTVKETPTANKSKILNITPSNCNQVSLLSAEEATINLTEIGPTYIKFELSNKDLIRTNNNPLPDLETPVNLYTDQFTDRYTNRVLTPYKLKSQFTSNVLEYKIVNKLNNIYTATITNPNIELVLEDVINGALYQYTTNDIGNRLIPSVLDSYILL